MSLIACAEEPILVRNIGQLLTLAGPARARRGAECHELGVLRNHALLLQQGRVKAILPEAEARRFEALEIDAEGGVVLPGFVDPHTHLLHAGKIQGTFAERCQAVEETAEAELLRALQRRVELCAQSGTTTLEIKTGYARSAEAEAKCLRVLAQVSRESDTWIRRTVMAPLSPRENYQWPEAHGCDFVDALCGPEGYSAEQLRPLLQSRGNCRVKLHVGVSGPSRAGLELALAENAISVEHLLHCAEADARMLAVSETIGVLLPAMPYYTRSLSRAPARLLLEAGAALALGSDANPGDSPTHSMPFVLHLACREWGLTAEEAITLGTINAAYAIACGEDCGSLEVGKLAKVLILEAEDYRDLPAAMGANIVRTVIRSRHTKN